MSALIQNLAAGQSRRQRSTPPAIPCLREERAGGQYREVRVPGQPDQSPAPQPREGVASGWRARGQRADCRTDVCQSSPAARRRCASPPRLLRLLGSARRPGAPGHKPEQSRRAAYVAASSRTFRSGSGRVVSREARVSDASLVDAVTKRSPVSALVITYSKVIVRERTSLMVVVTRIRLSYRAAE